MNMQKENAWSQFKLSRGSSGLPKVSISLRTSFKNRRCTDTALKVGAGRQNGSQNRLIGSQRGSRTAPRSFKLATAQATTFGQSKMSRLPPCRIVFSSNFGPNRLARLYIYIYIYVLVLHDYDADDNDSDDHEADRAIVRSLDRSIARSLDRSIARSLGRLVASSLGR